MKFESMFDDMLSEEAVQCSPPEEDIENEDGCISFQEGVEESVIDENIDQMLINEYQQALVQESESCIEKMQTKKVLKSSAQKYLFRH